ncbi:hypothetical protein [Nocardia stercoris]|uniref:hypothetical protein n=1 Tax=Nocardia stercoris TaxID=2483361 RepID=UPI0011C42364|nr:hypothetical protein [Nocardia stercoris]
MSMIFTPDVPAGELTIAECRQVRLACVAGDALRIRAAAERILETNRRRWHGRGDFESFPAIRRWQHFRSSPFATDPSPFELVEQLASGRRLVVPGAAAALAAAIMVTSGCPATSHHHDRDLFVTIYAQAADDLSLAEDLAVTVVEVAGGRVTQRIERTVVIVSAAPQTRQPAAPREAPAPVESPVVPTAA